MKFIATSSGMEYQKLTSDDLAQIELDSQQAQVENIIPSQAEIDQAEFELKSINLLIELGVI